MRVLWIGHQHGNEPRVEVFRSFGQLTAVHLGHPEIGEQEAHLPGMGLQEAEGGPAAVTASRLVPEGAHHARYD